MGTIESPPEGLSVVRDRAARFLMAVAAVGAAGATVSAVFTVLGSDDATRVVETWRLYGFMVFTGLFALLALKPRDYRGIWELVILNKGALTFTALLYIFAGGAHGAIMVVIADGVLTVMLVTAYILCRGWRARPPLRGE